MKRLVDENGKIFHRLNVLDAVIILIVLAVAIFAAFKFFTMDSLQINREYTDGTVTFRVYSMSEYQVAAMKEGDLISYVDFQKFGTITALTVEPRMDLVNASNGETYYVENPNYYTVTFTVQDGACYRDEKGFFVDRSYQVREGQYFVVSNGLVTADAVVLDTEIL